MGTAQCSDRRESGQSHHQKSEPQRDRLCVHLYPKRTSHECACFCCKPGMRTPNITSGIQGQFTQWKPASAIYHNNHLKDRKITWPSEQMQRGPLLEPSFSHRPINVAERHTPTLPPICFMGLSPKNLLLLRFYTGISFSEHLWFGKERGQRGPWDGLIPALQVKKAPPMSAHTAQV